MVQSLLIVGSSIFVLFGAAHGVFTFQDLGNPRNFTPRDAELRAAMQQATVAFHPKINLWRAWLGFHFSHSLGLVMFGGAFLYVGIFHPLLFSQSRLLQGCSILVSAVYLVLSLKFWFSKPAIGSGIAMGCFIMAAALSYI
ncbi:MAG: hypothetical protein M3367_08170 [Acidobacteriota bacterium]|nr:hypothetical protein [Acidobacteriota bacterium]